MIPLDNQFLSRLFSNDYSALLICTKKRIIKVISTDPAVSPNLLQGANLESILPSSIENGSEPRAIIKLPVLGTDQQFIISSLKLENKDSHIDRVLALQALPSLNLVTSSDKDALKDYKDTILQNSPIFIYVLDYKAKIFTEGLQNYSKLL